MQGRRLTFPGAQLGVRGCHHQCHIRWHLGLSTGPLCPATSPQRAGSVEASAPRPAQAQRLPRTREPTLPIRPHSGCNSMPAHAARLGRLGAAGPRGGTTAATWPGDKTSLLPSMMRAICHAQTAPKAQGKAHVGCVGSILPGCSFPVPRARTPLRDKWLLRQCSRAALSAHPWLAPGLLQGEPPGNHAWLLRGLALGHARAARAPPECALRDPCPHLIYDGLVRCFDPAQRSAPLAPSDAGTAQPRLAPSPDMGWAIHRSRRGPASADACGPRLARLWRSSERTPMPRAARGRTASREPAERPRLEKSRPGAAELGATGRRMRSGGVLGLRSASAP